MSQPSRPPLPRIPIPPGRRWEHFAVRFVPVIVFGIAAAVCTQLWKTRIAAPSFLAVVDQRTTEVRTPVSGTLQLSPEVAPLHPVLAGQTVGWVIPLPAAIATAELAALRRELDAVRTNHATTLDLRRIDLESARLQLEWMQARVELADLRAERRAAADTVRRFDTLQPSGSLAAQQLAQARVELEGLTERVAAQEAAVAELSPVVAELTASNHLPDDATALAASLDAARARLEALEQQLTPRPLTAPLSGVILAMGASGEALQAGDSAATIAATTPSHIVGFERQPLTLAAAPGDTVRVTTRRQPRRQATATLLEVSPALEPVPAEILALWRSTIPEQGRRFQFSLPSELSLLPGEQVEISLALP